MMNSLIHPHLAGQTVSHALTDGKDLILRLSDGAEVRIGWDESGPVFKGRDVKVCLQVPASWGFAGGLGHADL